MPFRVLARKSIISYTQSRNISYAQLRSWYASLVKKPPPIPPYSHVSQIGDPVLRTVSDEVPVDLIKSPEIKLLIKIMKCVFDKYDCVGLSAPQLGISLRVMMVELNRKHLKKYEKIELKNKQLEAFPQTIVINPKLRIIDYNKVIHPESCESIKGYWAEVPRYNAVEVSGFNEDGDKISMNAAGWLARILQHEFDHLNGKLYTDIMDRKSLTCCCWETVNERSGKVEIPFSQ